MAFCKVCKEEVDLPCRSNDEAIVEGCIKPPKHKRLLEPEVAKRVQSQSEGLHSTPASPGNWTS